MRQDPSAECGRVLPVLLIPRESLDATRLPLGLFVHERVLPLGVWFTTFAPGMSCCSSSVGRRTPLLALISASDSTSACARPVTARAARANACRQDMALLLRLSDGGGYYR